MQILNLKLLNFRNYEKLDITFNPSKNIIIGKNGQMLKEIGTQARLDLEEYFNKKVYLELYVKTIKNWRDRENHITELGLKNDLIE